MKKNFHTFFKASFAFVITQMFFAQGLLAQTTVTYNSSGSFMVPNGVTSVTVQAWGGGGGGGAKLTNGTNSKGGGGGGAYASSTLTVSPGSSHPFIVGNGGAPGAAGGASSFDGSVIIANGGLGASNNTGGAGGSGSTGDVTYDGGKGADKAGQTGGGGGGSALYNGVGGIGAVPTGGTGTGNGGNGGLDNNNGNIGNVPGGGGGGKGGGNAFVSGSGAHGRVIVSWNCPTYTAALSGSVSICPPVLCTNLTVTIATTLSTGPYTVIYNDGTNHTVTMTGSGTINVCPTVTTSYTLVSVTDSYGCHATTSGGATVTVGGPPPVFGSLEDLTIDCTDEVVFAEPTATNAVTITHNDPDVTTPGDCAGEYSITRTWTATNACGNTATASQTINVTDTNAPTLTCPETANVDCSASKDPTDTGTATAEDDCSGVTIGSSDVKTDGNCAGNYTIARTWTATDGCGNATNCVQTINVTDTNAPTLTCPTTANIDCTASTLPANTGTATASDDCSGVTIGSSDVKTNGNCAGNYKIARTWTATDGCGNATNCVQTINVTDTHAPTAICKDVTIYWDENAQASTSADAINNGSTDDCSGVNLSASQTSFGCADFGPHVVTLTVTDGCGNSSTCTATVTVAIPEYAICGNNNNKVYICHQDNGEPETCTICINPATHLNEDGNWVNSVCDHLNNHPGDVLGQCAVDNCPGGGHGRNDENAISATEITCIPNPFNGRTSINFGLNGTEHVSLKVFNNMGQLVNTLYTGNLDAGNHSYIFDGSSLSGGMYFFSLTTGKQVQTGKMLLVK